MPQAEGRAKSLVVSWHRRQGLKVYMSRDFYGWQINASVFPGGTVSMPIAFGTTKAEAWEMAAKEVAHSRGMSVAEMLVENDLNTDVPERNGNED